MEAPVSGTINNLLPRQGSTVKKKQQGNRKGTDK